MEQVYLDNAASTRVDDRVVEAMLPWFSEGFGNANSAHSFGRKARAAIEEARAQVARALGARPEEIRFTSGGSGAITLALMQAAFARAEVSRRIITTPIEHRAVLSACQALADQGFEVVFLPVDSTGLVDPADFAREVQKGAALASIIHVQNEVGTVEPVAELGALAREAGVPLHVDAIQSFGHLPFTVGELNCDLLSLAAHKFYGPKGVGVLYVARGTRLQPGPFSAAGDNALHPGTENTPGIVGCGLACELAVKELPERRAHEQQLAEQLRQGVLKQVPEVRLGGHAELRSPAIVHFMFAGVEGTSLVQRLDMAGIACSTGSACSSGGTDLSHVLKALRLPREFARGAVRFSLGKYNTPTDIARCLDVVPQAVRALRRLATG